MISYQPQIFSDNEKHLSRFGWRVSLATTPTDISLHMLSHAWSPYFFARGERVSKNFLMADFLALDFDTPEFSLKEAVDTFCDMKHVIGITRNHLREKKGITCERFRVVLKFEKRIKDSKILVHNLKKALEKYPADTSCKDPARFFYPCRDLVSISDEGYHYDVCQNVVEDKSYFDEYIKTCQRTKTLPAFVVRNLSTEIPVGKRNTACFAIAKDLTKCGYLPEEILEKIRFSETYRGVLSSELKEEIEATIKRAVKSAYEEPLLNNNL